VAFAITEEEMQLLMKEIEEEAQATVLKKRRLKASEKVKLRSAVGNIDKENLHVTIADKIESMVHISGIEGRRLLWENFKTSEWMSKVCNHFLSEYVSMHMECDKGADRFAMLYLTWYEQLQSPTSATSELLSTCRSELSTSCISDDTWTVLITTLLHVSFNVIQMIVSQHIQSATDAAIAVPTVTEDDDVGLLRLGGWALFSCIQYRKNALKGKSKTKHTVKKLQVYKGELEVLNLLVDDKKVGLPSAISAQDRGYMTFPSASMMPFMRELSRKMKQCINPSTYGQHGSKLFDVSPWLINNQKKLDLYFFPLPHALHACRLRQRKFFMTQL
jgi:hypothetical protein